MAQQPQLVGLIELDVAPELDVTLDENIGQTLRRLRRTTDRNTEPATNAFSFSYAQSEWHSATEPCHDGVIVLMADLHQLHSDLESELARLLDRLLMVS